LSHQFGEWEKEEIELQKEETQAKINEMKAEGEPIPEYMLRLLNQFSPEDNVPTVEAKLPIVAVIGRPNTGKSTIVNKLANCHKVRSAKCPRNCFDSSTSADR
jgi:ribosome biogenesis GTPase A